MATEIDLIVANLTSFYDFRNKIVVHVGAGSGQLLGYASLCRKVIAVDNDLEALERLEQKIKDLALGQTVSAVACDFYDLELPGDVVLFEFCLHEMREPSAAIDLARAMADDVVVIDHLPESRWSWYANEEKAVAETWKAVAKAKTKQLRSYEAIPRFDDFRELEAKFSPLGEESVRRIGALKDQKAIEIPMPYGIGLL